MNFVADESVDRQIVENLRVKGHPVLYVVEMDPGVSNGEVFEIANRTNSILMTGDKDFGELSKAFSVITPGAIRVRRKIA